jgi:hypothetical protein
MRYTYVDRNSGWLVVTSERELDRSRWVPVSRSVIGQPDLPDWPIHEVSVA